MCVSFSFSLSYLIPRRTRKSREGGWGVVLEEKRGVANEGKYVRGGLEGKFLQGKEKEWSEDEGGHSLSQAEEWERYYYY